MRKIETLMNAAITEGRNFTSGNTMVTHHAGVAFVFLHGNCIAQVRDDSISLFDGGHQSNTTKSRLNAILSAFGMDGERVFAKNFDWFVNYNGSPIPFFSGMRLA